jgi:hypothetical protein
MRRLDDLQLGCCPLGNLFAGHVISLPESQS